VNTPYNFLVLLVAVCTCAVSPIRSYPQEQRRASSPDISCDGKVRELPADLVGRPYRSQCYRGVEVVAWADVVPARFGKKAQNAVFVIAVNQTIEPVRIGLDEFAIGQKAT
jgi:hypothetical protein